MDPMRYPELRGRAVEVRFVPDMRDRRGPVHGGSSLRGRRIDFDAELKRGTAEFARILTHELFHFAWVRLSNSVRRSWEDLLAREVKEGTAGELGWSAEWRKAALDAPDRARRTRRWREYCCESFCDTAAWLFAGVPRHPEFTLEARGRSRRRRWFALSGVARRISI